MLNTIKKTANTDFDTSYPDYRYIRTIGSGSFGFVFEAYDEKTQQRVAIKRVQKIGNQMSREYEILLDIKECDYVVKILDFFYTRTDDDKLIQNSIFEYIDSNLEDLIQKTKEKNQYISIQTIKKIMYQLLSGLVYIHKKNICHRDLKPENILYNNDGIVKICDFGSSKVLDREGKNTPYIVSRYYRAPELILAITNYSVSIDIWAVGCIMYELVNQEILFQGKTEGDQLKQILLLMGSPNDVTLQKFQDQVPYDTKIFEEFKGFPKNQIQIKRKQKLLTQDETNFLDLLGEMLIYDPDRRITAQDSLNHAFFDEVRSLFPR